MKVRCLKKANNNASNVCPMKDMAIQVPGFTFSQFVLLSFNNNKGDLMH